MAYEGALAAAYNASSERARTEDLIAKLKADIEKKKQGAPLCYDPTADQHLLAVLEKWLQMCQAAEASLWSAVDRAVERLEAAWDRHAAARKEYSEAKAWNDFLRGWGDTLNARSDAALEFIFRYAWEHKSCISCHNFKHPLEGDYTQLGIVLATEAASNGIGIGLMGAAPASRALGAAKGGAQSVASEALELTEGQAASLVRFNRKLPAGSTGTHVDALARIIHEPGAFSGDMLAMRSLAS